MKKEEKKAAIAERKRKRLATWRREHADLLRELKILDQEFDDALRRSE